MTCWRLPPTWPRSSRNSRTPAYCRTHLDPPGATPGGSILFCSTRDGLAGALPPAISLRRCAVHHDQGSKEEPMVRRLSLALLSATAALAFTAARAASTYDGDGQVPQQFVISGKA